jgi:hypothetical protein
MPDALSLYRLLSSPHADRSLEFYHHQYTEELANRFEPHVC